MSLTKKRKAGALQIDKPNANGFIDYKTMFSLLYDILPNQAFPKEIIDLVMQYMEKQIFRLLNYKYLVDLETQASYHFSNIPLAIMKFGSSNPCFLAKSMDGFVVESMITNQSVFLKHHRSFEPVVVTNVPMMLASIQKQGVLVLSKIEVNRNRLREIMIAEMTNPYLSWGMQFAALVHPGWLVTCDGEALDLWSIQTMKHSERLKLTTKANRVKVLFFDPHTNHLYVHVRLLRFVECQDWLLFTVKCEQEKMTVVGNPEKHDGSSKVRIIPKWMVIMKKEDKKINITLQNIITKESKTSLIDNFGSVQLCVSNSIWHFKGHQIVKAISITPEQILKNGFDSCLMYKHIDFTNRPTFSSIDVFDESFSVY